MLSVLRHLFAWAAYQSGQKPKATDEALARLALYSTARRRVTAEPKDR